MNPWWLVFLLPASAAFGAAVMALMTAAKREDDEMDKILRDSWRGNNDRF